MATEESRTWSSTGLRWAQTAILGTLLLLFSRASLKILEHEIEVAKLSQMHQTKWADALESARKTQTLMIWGSDDGFAGALVTLWVISSGVVLTKYSLIMKKNEAPRAIIQIALCLCVVLGIYWLVVTIMVAVDYEDISCSLDTSANAMIDAESQNAYVTCVKQDYTEDLFRRSFIPLLVLLATSFLLSVFIHAAEEFERETTTRLKVSKDEKTGVLLASEALIF